MTGEKIRKKIKSNGGFSMLELLVATLIMLLATSLLAQTMALGLQQFRTITKRSKADTLCSTLSIYVENELAYAKVKVKDGQVTFTSDVHNMGPDAAFYILESAEDEDGTVVTSGESPVGIIVETSDYYKNYVKEKNIGLQPAAQRRPYYSIVGEGSYKIGDRSSEMLAASMSLKNTSDSIEVTISVYDTDGETVLSSNHFRVIPLEFEKSE